MQSRNLRQPQTRLAPLPIQRTSAGVADGVAGADVIAAEARRHRQSRRNDSFQARQLLRAKRRAPRIQARFTLEAEKNP